MREKKHLKFVKYCKLDSCQRQFETNREWQNFCRDADPDNPDYCYNEFWRIMKSARFSPLKKITSLENRIEKLEQQRETKNAD